LRRRFAGCGGDVLVCEPIFGGDEGDLLVCEPIFGGDKPIFGGDLLGRPNEAQ